MGHRRRSHRHRGARRTERRRREGGGAAEHHARSPRLRDADPPRRHRLRAGAQPRGARGQRPLGGRAHLVEPRDRDSRRDARVHRDRNGLESRRGDPRSGADRAQGDHPDRGRRLRDLLHPSARRAVGAPGGGDRRRADDASRAPAGGGRLRERPDPRRRPEPRAGGDDAGRRGDLRRHPRGHDPLHRDERGRHRRVPHHVLDGELPPAAGTPAHACIRASRRRGSRSSCSRASSRSSCSSRAT